MYYTQCYLNLWLHCLMWYLLKNGVLVHVTELWHDWWFTLLDGSFCLGFGGYDTFLSAPDVPRSGIFCCLVVFLINYCKWQVCRPSGLPILVARNCIKFTLPSCPCSVTLIDSFAQFEVHVNSPVKFCSEICPIIRQKIFDGIDAAAATLRYNNNTPHSAFFCAHTPKDSEKTTLHTATLSKDRKWCMCTEDEDMFYELNDRQTVWFDTAVAASDSGM